MDIEAHLAQLDRENRYGPSPDELDLLQSITPVSRETILRLTLYRALLERWQKKTNLVAPGTLADFWKRHIVDSLQILPIAAGSGQVPRHWIDIGSGGGFPGMAIALILTDYASAENGYSVVMVESIQKKCAFLRRVLAETGAVVAGHSAIVECTRIESVAERFEPSEIITARALAPLSKLLELTGPHLASGSSKGRRALFHKGRDHQRETEESRGAWEFDLVVHPSEIDPESVILEIANVSRRGDHSCRK